MIAFTLELATNKPLLAALSFALLAACNSNAVVPSPTAGPGGADTYFTVSGRYIDLSDAPVGSSGVRPAAGLKFFVKGMVYSPTPIGTTVGQPPLLDDALRNGNSAIWSRDLPRMRAMGVNAIHVYNVFPPPDDNETGPISDFLNAAWNGGKQPVYVIMSIYFTGDKLYDKNEVNKFAKKYHDLDAKYAMYPAVMGVAISNEIGERYWTDPKWWQAFNVIAKAAKQGFVDGGDGAKIVTTSEADHSADAIKYGTQNSAAVDAWGVNVYRGRTVTDLFAQIKEYTKSAPKPVMLTEYGATAAYHPAWKNTYEYKTGLDDRGVCIPNSRNGPASTDVKELPRSGNPNMAGLVDLVTNNAKLLYSGYKDGGIVSGGFYFEWSDEWWKAGNPSKHVGSDFFKDYFPGCGEDAAWFGLNAVAKGSGTLDVLKPRPTLSALQTTWSPQQ